MPMTPSASWSTSRHRAGRCTVLSDLLSEVDSAGELPGPQSRGDPALEGGTDEVAKRDRAPTLYFQVLPPASTMGERISGPLELVAWTSWMVPGVPTRTTE